MKVVLLLILAVFLIYPLSAAPIGWNLPPVGNITFSPAVKKILDSRANVSATTVSPVQDNVWDTLIVQNTTASYTLSAPATLSHSEKELLTSSYAPVTDYPAHQDTDTTASGMEQDSTTTWSYFYVTLPTTASPASAGLSLKSGEQDESYYADVLHLAMALFSSPLAIFLAVFMALGMSFYELVESIQGLFCPTMSSYFPLLSRVSDRLSQPPVCFVPGWIGLVAVCCAKIACCDFSCKEGVPIGTDALSATQEGVIDSQESRI